MRPFPCHLDSSRLPLLITGISGVAGFNAFHYFQDRYPGKVVGIRTPTTPIAGRDVVPLDAEDTGGLERLFGAWRFRSVLNCAGNCALKACELNPNMARVLNVHGADVIVRLARRQDARLVHLSTDLVFSGMGQGGYREEEPVDPVTVYGKTMAEGEQLVAAEIIQAALLRISLPMGRSYNRCAGAIDWIESRFRCGRPATLYFDEVRSVTYTDDLSQVLERFLAGDEAGLFHVGGPRALTLFEIGQIVNRVGGYAPCLLKGCLRREAAPIPPRAGNVSMNSDKLAHALGCRPFRPWPAECSLVPTGPEWHHERTFAGSHERIAELLYGAGVQTSRVLTSAP